jgi:transposase InsO family protein
LAIACNASRVLFRPHRSGRRAAVLRCFTGRATRAEVEWETARRVRWYSTTRLHSSIDYTSPIEYEQRYRDRTPAAPGREMA